MEQMRTIIEASAFYRVLAAICLWFSGQWKGSGVIQWFIHPSLALEQAESQNSIFYRLWRKIHQFLNWLWRTLWLEKLFEGSIFLKSWLWCGAAVALAPVLPTMAVLGLVVVGSFSVLLNLARDAQRDLFCSSMNRYVWLYAAVYLGGTIFSVTFWGSLLGGMLTVVFILFILVLENAVTTRRQLEFLLVLVVAAGTVVALLGISQYFLRWGYQSEAWVDSDMFGDAFRVSATLENPNMLGQYLTLTIPLGGAGMLASKTWGKRLAYLCCCGIMCVCMLMTLSRGAWLGLLAAGGIFVLLVCPRLLLLTPLALVAMYFVLPDAVIARFTSIGDLGDSSSSYRLSIWMGSLAMLKDYWICGVGPGVAAFDLVYPAYSYSMTTAQHSHNLYLQLLCDAGIIALVVFLLLIYRYARELCAAFCAEKNWGARVYQAAFLAGCGGFLLQGMTDFSFYNYRVLFIFCAYLGLGILMARWKTLKEGEGTS